MKFTDYQPIDISACRADELAPISKHMDASAPEIWINLAEMFYLTLRANPELAGVSDDALGLCATQAVYQMATDFGGYGVYLPKGVKPRQAEKSKAIAAEFTGHNSQALAKKYGITDMRVRQILAVHRANVGKPAHQDRKQQPQKAS